MKLIVDAGSTKTAWVLLEDGNEVKRFITRGFNPNYNKTIDFNNILYKELPGDFPVVDAVYYYGSGCGNENARQEMQQILKIRFEEASEVFVTHDLMGACHAVLGHQKGIACILGTGANACVFDGNNITQRAVSLGYLVGDEGSGCYIGRKLTRAYFYNIMPHELKLEFDNTYHLEINEFIDRVYHQPGASRYLAGFVEFAGKHISHPFIKNLVKECFDDFVKVFLLRFDECTKLPICFVGSVAYYFQGVLQECLAAEGLTMGKVMQSPLDGLIQLYS